MNKDLNDLAQIIDNLPQNIGHFSVFTDIKSGEFIYSCDTLGEQPFENVSKLYKNHVEEGVIDTQMELFRGALYAMFFAFAQQEGVSNLGKFVTAIGEIIEEY
jgi:hypothetical protein